MARPASGVAREVGIYLRLKESEVRALDAHRGGLSRQDYLRALLRRQVAGAATNALLDRAQRDITERSDIT